VTNFLPMWRLSAAPATKGRGSSEQAVEPERITQTEEIIWRLAVEPETGVWSVRRDIGSLAGAFLSGQTVGEWPLASTNTIQLRASLELAFFDIL
jgi:hypothetical protein